MANKHPWAIKLSKAIDVFCESKGFFKSDLADRLDIPRSIWGDVSSGNAITKAEYYARIFVYTEASEADPRRLPPRTRKTPRGGEFEEVRAWSEEQFQAWMESEGDQWRADKPARPTPTTPVQSTAPPVSKPVREEKKPRRTVVASEETPGQLIGRGIDMILERMGTSQAASQDVSEWPTKTLADELRKRLLVIFSMPTSEERDEALSGLLPALATLKEVVQILVSPKRTREESIEETRRME